MKERVVIELGKGRVGQDGLVRVPSTALQAKTVHVFDPRSIHAVQFALDAGRALLVRGKPGVGKSQLARAAAAALDWKFEGTVVDAAAEARDFCYRVDLVARLAEAQIAGALATARAGEDVAKVRERLAVERYVRPGPLWRALDYAGAARVERAWRDHVAAREAVSKDEAHAPCPGVVLLIDEVDKGESALPNGLLAVLADGAFDAPGHAVSRKNPSLVVFTTNDERALPDAFLRRCIVLDLEFPKADAAEAELRKLADAHFPKLHEDVKKEAANMLLGARDNAAGAIAPGYAEYLDLLRALDGQSKEAALDRLKVIGEFVLEKHKAGEP
jgi:MoxR-like ATPase